MSVSRASTEAHSFDTVGAYCVVRRGLEGAVFRAAVPTLSTIDILELVGVTCTLSTGETGRRRPSVCLPSREFSTSQRTGPRISRAALRTRPLSFRHSTTGASSHVVEPVLFFQPWKTCHPVGHLDLPREFHDVDTACDFNILNEAVQSANTADPLHSLIAMNTIRRTAQRNADFSASRSAVATRNMRPPHVTSSTSVLPKSGSRGRASHVATD